MKRLFDLYRKKNSEEFYGELDKINDRKCSEIKCNINKCLIHREAQMMAARIESDVSKNHFGEGQRKNI